MRITILSVLLGCVSVALAAPVTIVENGAPRAAIVVAAGANEQLRAAAVELQECVAAASGATLEIVGAPVEGLAAIHIGDTGAGIALPDLAGLDDDGFVISVPAPGQVLIVGPTDWGTEFGVYDFLERYLGVRWLLPGEHGRDVPAATTITVPDSTVRDQPKFFSRLMSGWRGAEQVKWTRRMRMHGRISFHHNLINLFPPAQYTQTHPEFFPIINGQRRLPKPEEHGWQPCFTAPGLVEEAVKNISAYFDQHPDATSYSLGVNDSSGHCQCDRCRAADPRRKNVIGYDHLSDRYFAWANAVVERVLQKYPDKWFGCLAYSEVFEPPDTVKVHERIIPYITYDRMKWIEPQLRAQGEEMTRKWQAMSPTLGWYDYIYGSPYCLPRVWMHHMADYYRFGYEHGVRAMYAEAYPNFGEGPKLYVALKLQWDPYQDVDALLDEWYTRCAGPEGAPYLKRYYEFWEDFWTRRILQSAWFTKGGQYLNFSSAGYLADIGLEEIAQCRQWLEAARERAQTDEQRARVEMLLLAFEYYESSAYAYPRAQANSGPLDSEHAALAAIADASARIEHAAKRRHLALEVLANDPVLSHALPLTRYSALEGSGWGATSLWTVYDWLQRSEAVRAKIAELAESAQDQMVRDQARIMLALSGGGELENLAANPSFEEDSGWSFWVKFEGRMVYSDEVAHSGRRSVLCEGVQRGGPHQSVRLQPGRYAAVCFVYVPAEQTSSGTVELAITPRDAANSNLPGLSTKVVPQPGRWMAVATGGDIRAQINGKDVAGGLFLPIVDGFKPGEKVFIDDIALFRLGDIEK